MAEDINGQRLKVATSNAYWVGKLVNNETLFEVALELEEEDDGCVVVIPWHAVEYVRAHTDG